MKCNPYGIFVIMSAIALSLSIYSILTKKEPTEAKEKLSSFAHFSEAWLVDDTVFLIDGRDTIKRTIKR